MKRPYNLMIIANLIMFLTLFTANNYFYKNGYEKRDAILITIIIAVIIMVGMLYVYEFIMISNKFKKVKKYTGIHFLTIFFSMFIPLLIDVFSKFELNIFITVIGILSTVFLMISIKGMKEEGVDFEREREILRKIGEIYNERTHLIKERMCILLVYFVITITTTFHPEIYIFILILIISAVIIKTILNKMRKEYLKFEIIKNKDINILFLLSFILFSLTILNYVYDRSYFNVIILSIYIDFPIKTKIRKSKYLEVEKMSRENS